jgi:4-amino-4-deoxy-L-arabinose transferase-like glycosyltransferase
VALGLLLPGAGAAYWDRDEAEYAAVARGAARSGSFFVPRWDGHVYFEKPPLLIWMTVLSIRTIGPSEAEMRLPVLLLAAGACVVLFLIGAEILDLRRGLGAAAVFGSSVLFLVYGRLLLTDVPLLFFDLLAVLALVRLFRARGRWFEAVWGGISLGLAVLAKGPVAVLVPGLFVAGALSRRNSRPGRLIAPLVLFFLIGGGVSLAWFAAAAQASRGQIVRSFLVGENIFRFAHAMEGHGGPFWYYVPVVFVGMLPWSGALLAIFRRGPQTHAAYLDSFSGGNNPLRSALLFWAIGLVVFFSLGATKLPHYVLLALPALALLVVWHPARAATRTAAWATAAAGAALFLAALAACCSFSLPGVAGRALVPFGLYAAGGALLPILPERGRFAGALTTALISGLLLGLVAVPTLEAACSLPGLGRSALRVRRPGEPVAGLRIGEPTLDYYAGLAETPRLENFQAVAHALAASPTSSLLLFATDRDGLDLVRTGRLRVRVLDFGFNLVAPPPLGLLELVRVGKKVP